MAIKPHLNFLNVLDVSLFDFDCKLVLEHRIFHLIVMTVLSLDAMKISECLDQINSYKGESEKTLSILSEIKTILSNFKKLFARFNGESNGNFLSNLLKVREFI